MNVAGTAEDLTRDQRDDLERNLRALRDEVRGALAAARTGGEPVDLGLPIGRISRMDAIQQQQMAQAGAAALERRLLLIDAAFASLAAETYGLCRICGGPVGFRRLKARPETPLCIRCQESAESGR